MLAGNGAVLILDTQPSSGGQEDAYQSAGVRYTRVPLYETLIETEKNPTLASTLSQGPLYVLFTSTSAVEGFLAMVKGCPLENAICICIGRKTLLAAKAAGLTAVLSSQPTQEAMLDKLLELYEKRSGQCG